MKNAVTCNDEINFSSSSSSNTNTKSEPTTSNQNIENASEFHTTRSGKLLFIDNTVQTTQNTTKLVHTAHAADRYNLLDAAVASVTTALLRDNEMINRQNMINIETNFYAESDGLRITNQFKSK